MAVRLGLFRIPTQVGDETETFRAELLAEFHRQFPKPRD
tara:strand:+ start:4981 stop:5097 length:117 start_codon:yes stop_codon:yes gene_type:complete